MDWVQFGLLIAAMGGMFQWLRTDITTNRVELSADRRDLLQILREMKEENKNFHGRLCALEERKKDK